MSGRLAEHLRSKGETARTVTTKVRYPDFAIRSRSTSLPIGTDDPERIAELACALLDRALDDRAGPLRLVGVGLVDDDDLINAVGERVRDSVFGHAGAIGRHGLNDEIAGLERMHRERADVFQAAAGMGIERAVPGERHLFGVDGEAFAQAVELEFQARPEHRL